MRSRLRLFHATPNHPNNPLVPFTDITQIRYPRMPNSLTRTAGLQLGPIALDTLLKHYFDRVKKEKEGLDDDHPLTQLRQDELLYDEGFNIAKACLALRSCSESS